jgi:hypothetical protein
MEALLGVVIDGGPQIFKIAACPTRASATGDIFAAGLAINLGQFLCPKEFIESV